MYDEKLYKKDLQKIRGGLRQAFTRSHYLKAFLQSKRIEIPQFKKDGTPAKRPKVVYECAECHGHFSSKDINVDHIERVGKFTSFDQIEQFFSAIFCPYENLQILCRPCHDTKTAWERRLVSKKPMEAEQIL